MAWPVGLWVGIRAVPERRPIRRGYLIYDADSRVKPEASAGEAGGGSDGERAADRIGMGGIASARPACRSATMS